MNDFSKISYFDLKWEAKNARLPASVGFSKEVERLNQLMVGRELKMVELKKEIQELRTKKGGEKHES